MPDAPKPASPSPAGPSPRCPARGRARRRKRAAATALAAMAAASGTVGGALLTATPPGVEVARVALRGLGLFEQGLGVTLCVSNTNDTELSFRRVAVSLDVAGAPLAVAESEVAVRLPPRSSVLVPFSVATTLRDLGPQLLALVRAGGVDYRLRGTVRLGGTLDLALPFSHSGRLDLLAASRGLLADAAAPVGSRCGPATT